MEFRVLIRNPIPAIAVVATTEEARASLMREAKTPIIKPEAINPAKGSPPAILYRDTTVIEAAEAIKKRRKPNPEDIDETKSITWHKFNNSYTLLYVLNCIGALKLDVSICQP